SGIDLVRCQIEMARGDRLEIRQDRLRPRGWALECRVLAEDPVNAFCPSPGRIPELRLPAGPSVRVDTALQPGDEISLHYDALVAGDEDRRECATPAGPGPGPWALAGRRRQMEGAMTVRRRHP